MTDPESTLPHVTLNFAMSLDGKISTAARGRFRFTSGRDRRVMDEIRARSDAVLIGGATLRAEDPPLQVRDARLREGRILAGHDEKLINIVLSASLNLPLGGRFFTTPGIRRIVATVEDARAELLASVKGLAEIVRLGQGRVPIPELLKRLSERGISRLLVEGGGEVNASFFEAGCVDEIYVTVAPIVIGGRSAPTPAGGEGFLAGGTAAFELVSCRSEENEIFIHYRRRSAAPGSS